MSDAEVNRPYYTRDHDELRDTVTGGDPINIYFNLLAILHRNIGEKEYEIAKNRLRDTFKAISDPTKAGHDNLNRLISKLREINLLIPTPNGFPSIDEIRASLERTNEEVESNFIIGVRPGVEELNTDDIVNQANVKSIEQVDTGVDLATMVQQTAIIMTNQRAYEACFDPNDQITINPLCEVVNGRIRALALKSVGNHIVEQFGMDYIKAKVVWEE